jgi:hypothetical protein
MLQRSQRAVLSSRAVIACQILTVWIIRQFVV